MRGRLPELRSAGECTDCGVRFAWDESPDDDRCAACAEVHDWNHGGAS